MGGYRNQRQAGKKDIKITTMDEEERKERERLFLFLSFRSVLNVIYSFLGNSPVSEF